MTKIRTNIGQYVLTIKASGGTITNEENAIATLLNELRSLNHFITTGVDARGEEIHYPKLYISRAVKRADSRVKQWFTRTSLSYTISEEVRV